MPRTRPSSSPRLRASCRRSDCRRASASCSTASSTKAPGDALYLGVTCFDSEPTKWLGYQRQRDEFLQSDDRFMWAIDTFLDGRSGYFFEMNPSGLTGDSTFDKLASKILYTHRF